MKTTSIAVLVFLATSIGCQVDVSAPIKTNSNRATTTANGHTLSVASDVSKSTSLVDDTETVRLGDHQLVVEFTKHQVFFDGKELVALPSETKQLDVEYLEGKLVLKADGNLLILPANSN